MRPHTNPDEFFDHNEYILADSGLMCTPYFIPMFKKPRVTSLGPRTAYFNAKAAPMRVQVEHAFGVLKSRWRILKNGNFSAGQSRTTRERRAASCPASCCTI
ncbi:hypothetical protein P7C73_g3756, partial [Tremellales sp. Uapishka_1]